MADEMTPRERRAQRAQERRSEKAGGRGATASIRWRTLRGPAIAVLIVGAAIGAIVLLQINKPDCPGHWHATQMVFVPSGEKDADGFDLPRRINWESPRAANGGPYYDLSNDPNMDAATHMHQSGPETGTAAGIGPSQFHFEPMSGTCVGIQRAFNTIDLDVDADSIATVPGTPLATANPGGPWVENGNQTIRFFVQSRGDDRSWYWSEKEFADHLHYQLKDGESMLLALGHYSDRQIQDMMDQNPKGNNSRSANDPTPPWYTPPAATTSTASRPDEGSTSSSTTAA